MNPSIQYWLTDLSELTGFRTWLLSLNIIKTSFTYWFTSIWTQFIELLPGCFVDWDYIVARTS
jgi:hypothetical protein